MRSGLLIISLFTVVVFVACGRPFKDDGRDGYTKIQVAGHESALMENGLGIFAPPTVDAMLFAADQNNPGKLGRLYLSGGSELASPSTKTWLMPNGTYKFAMVGYSNASMGGNPACALGADGGSAGANIVLGGGSKTVTFTAAACTATPFKESNNYSAISLAVCSNSDNISALAFNAACGTAAPGVGSLIVTVHSADEFNGSLFAGLDNPSGAVLRSACVVLSTGVGSTTVKFLGGSVASGFPLRTEVILYGSADCSGNPHSTMQFQKGFAAADLGASTGVLGVLYGSTAFTDKGTMARWVDNATTPRLFLKQLN